MNAGIINNWKQLVKDDDTVFVLGDLGFCGIEKLRAEIEQLPGQIYVIQGNHDSNKNLAKLKEEGLIKDYCKIQEGIKSRRICNSVLTQEKLQG